MLADDIKATESRIKQLEQRYLQELSESAQHEKAPRTAEPEAFRSAARMTAYLTRVEIEKEQHKLIDQLFARVRELETQLASRENKVELVK
jgi:hypothetical protein